MDAKGDHRFLISSSGYLKFHRYACSQGKRRYKKSVDTDLVECTRIYVILHVPFILANGSSVVHRLVPITVWPPVN